MGHANALDDRRFLSADTGGIKRDTDTETKKGGDREEKKK